MCVRVCAEGRFRGNDSVNEMHDDQEAPTQTTHVRKRVPTKFIEVKAGCGATEIAIIHPFSTVSSYHLTII